MISRAGYAGLQRHALQWTGDNSSWWEHLWMSMPQLQNLGLSGIAWAGVDIGGFFDDCDGELLARWTEFGIFQPFVRNHSAMGTAKQEPWAFGEPWESICREMLRLRMQLVPYLYTAFEACHRTGAPVLRPLLFDHPDDPDTYAADDQFLVGSDLLVAPITRPGVEHRHVYLPAGAWHALLDRRALRRPGAHPRPRTAGPTGGLRPRQHPDPARRPGHAHRRAVRLDVARVRLTGLRQRVALRGRRRWLRRVSRRTAHVETGSDGRVRFSLSEREGSFVPTRSSTRVLLGAD